MRQIDRAADICPVNRDCSQLAKVGVIYSASSSIVRPTEPDYRDGRRGVSIGDRLE